MSRPQVAVSRCLLGEPVRYDGRDKYTPELIRAIAPHCEIIPLCPEVEAGLSVPRPPVQIVLKNGEALTVVGREEPDLDVTQPLQQMANAFCSQYASLAGAILQNRSPSCGVGDTPHYSSNGIHLETGDGLFTQTLRAAAPSLPIETPASLSHPGAIDRFLQQVSNYN